MTAGRLFAIVLILILASFAWAVLGGSVQLRTDRMTEPLTDKVAGLWGSPQTQVAPTFAASWPNPSSQATATVAAPVTGSRLEIDGSDITVDFKLDQRRKGLLWYATYVVGFDAVYKVTNPATSTAETKMTFTFPDPQGIYDGFKIAVDGRDVPISYRAGAGDGFESSAPYDTSSHDEYGSPASGQGGYAVATFDIPAGKTVEVATGYSTNGLDTWVYEPRPEGAGLIEDFHLTMHTDFADVDYPGDGISPTARESSGSGLTLSWDYDSVVSGRPIGLVMPSPTNPGPLVSRITFFAPVSLLFFFAALVLLTTTSSVRLHPVHYGFLAAAFFAFHLLLTYLADQIDLHVAFALAAAVSVLLVLGYLRVVVGTNKALAEIAVSQLVFLILFSYSFFFKGITGLAITIGSILTLAFFMAKTSRVDWDAAFERKPRQRPMPPMPMMAQPAVAPTASAQVGQTPIPPAPPAPPVPPGPSSGSAPVPPEPVPPVPPV
ncbi:MAG: inner membrane CreD family protein [Coriobacteriia bacterium]|nr:inner membrane CreD family protein [Coriobacteriia bacterium]